MAPAMKTRHCRACNHVFSSPVAKCSNCGSDNTRVLNKICTDPGNRNAQFKGDGFTKSTKPEDDDE